MEATLAHQIEVVRAEFDERPKGLRAHVERVLDEALDLATRWDLDTQRVELAVWGHDLFRALKPRAQLALAREVGLAPGPEEERSPVLLHGPTAAAVLRERFGVRDDDALDAVRDHTAGLAQMSMLAKVILIADKVEKRKRRRAPAMEGIRRLARRDLDTALLCWADWKWVDERRHGWDSYTAHWSARIGWVGEHHADSGLPGRTADDAPELDAQFELLERFPRAQPDEGEAEAE
jgi:nicotinate-nucleotide adenylyltransferase